MAALRDVVQDGFSFDEVDKTREEQNAALRKKYPAKVKMRTPNQILRRDGKLIEADAPLYASEVISDDPAEDFDDFPG